MIEAIIYIYDNTEETSDARKAIVESASKNLHILLKSKKKEMAKMMADLSEFGRDMVMQLVENETDRAKATLEEKRMDLWHCANCDIYWKMSDTQINLDMFCSACEEKVEWVSDPRNKWECADQDCREVIMSNVGGFGRRKWTCNNCREKGFEAVED